MPVDLLESKQNENGVEDSVSSLSKIQDEVWTGMDKGFENIELRFPFQHGLTEFLRQAILEDCENARLSKAFRAFYSVRSLVPIFVRQLLQKIRNKQSTVANDWYIPTKLIDAVSQFGAPDSIWPDDSEFAFVLTHDVETEDGMKLIPQLAKIEEDLGFRSSWNLVPHKYSIDRSLVEDLKSRGFEIGIHGYNHDGKLFLSKQIFDKRVPPINQAFKDYDSIGFRTPMVHRNLAWMQQLHMEHDSSCFDVDPFQAMPGGIQSVWPFIFGRFVELPYTMPQDHTLLISLGETSDQIWRDKLDRIADLKGMAMMLTHPDYLDTPERLNVYRSFLEYVKERGRFWHALPREVADLTRSLAGQN